MDAADAHLPGGFPPIPKDWHRDALGVYQPDAYSNFNDFNASCSRLIVLRCFIFVLFAISPLDFSDRFSPQPPAVVSADGISLDWGCRALRPCRASRVSCASCNLSWMWKGRPFWFCLIFASWNGAWRHGHCVRSIRINRLTMSHQWIWGNLMSH